MFPYIPSIEAYQRYPRQTWADRAFQRAAPELWNELPNHVRNQDKLVQIKKSLKAHLFEVYRKDIHLQYQNEPNLFQAMVNTG